MLFKCHTRVRKTTWKQKKRVEKLRFYPAILRLKTKSYKMGRGEQYCCCWGIVFHPNFTIPEHRPLTCPGPSAAGGTGSSWSRAARAVWLSRRAAAAASVGSVLAAPAARRPGDAGGRRPVPAAAEPRRPPAERRQTPGGDRSNYQLHGLHAGRRPDANGAVAGGQPGQAVLN